MSKYTTGEIAKLCGVSVRTVQYYDTRGILNPSELSEGGRRLYSETDLQRMKIVCFLRELDLPLNSIGELLSEEHPESVISILLEQQEKTLREEIAQKQARLDKLTDLRRALKELEHFSVESIGDIARKMENKKKLRKLYTVLFATGIPIGIVEWAGLIFWIVTGNWRPFVFYLVVAVPYTVVISIYFFRRVAYICPECHTVFRPSFKEAFFARHTRTLRKVTCTHCGHKGFCVETYGGDQDEVQP
jgi:DNA-binding transcriptional MerR regulator/DNA-directed RNA polymerase subunit RPC12/RpoP